MGAIYLYVSSRKSVSREHCEIPLNHCMIILVHLPVTNVTLAISCVVQWVQTRMSRIRVNLNLHVTPESQNDT